MGYGKARRTFTYDTPTSFSARDEFNQTAGVLNGKTLPLGGTWATSGPGADFTVEETGKTAQRTSTSDTGYKFAIAGATNFTTVAVQADMKSTYPLGGVQTVIARWVDANNFLLGEISGSGALFVTKTVAGTSTPLGELQSNLTPPRTVGPNTLRLVVEASGRWALWRDGVLVLIGQDSALATGGALATGKPGFAEFYPSATAATRNVDNFAAWVPEVDTAIHAGRSIEFKSYGDNPIERQDASGAYWGAPGEGRGGRIWLPPKGAANRTTRIAVLARRHDIETQPSEGITDSLSVQVKYRPRYLAIPRQP